MTAPAIANDIPHTIYSEVGKKMPQEQLESMSKK